MVSKRSLEVRDLDETDTREEVIAAMCIALGKPDLGKLRVGWANCRIREQVEVSRCLRRQGYGHVSRGCTLPGRKDACWRCRGASHVAKESKAPPSVRNLPDLR